MNIENWCEKAPNCAYSNVNSLSHEKHLLTKEFSGMKNFLWKMSIKALYPFISYSFLLPYSNIHGTKRNKKIQRKNIKINFQFLRYNDNNNNNNVNLNYLMLPLNLMRVYFCFLWMSNNVSISIKLFAPKARSTKVAGAGRIS